MSDQNTPLSAAALEEATKKILAGLNVGEAFVAKAAADAKALLDRRVAKLNSLINTEQENLNALAAGKPDVQLYDADGNPATAYYSERANQQRQGWRNGALWARKGIELASNNDDTAWKIIDNIYNGYYDDAKKLIVARDAALAATK
jgi:hypothetical protein